MADRAPTLSKLFDITYELGEPQDIGPTPRGHQVIVPVTGGTFRGPRLSGEVLAPGLDWMLVRPDDCAELDVRVTLQTDDGALIGLAYRGILTQVSLVVSYIARGQIPPAEEYSLMITPVFQTSAQEYAWLNGTMAVGTGRSSPGEATYSVFAITR
jgi:hypothetical protein